MQLQVLEAYTRDIGRGIARIDYQSMDDLGVSTGDVLNVGKTVVKVHPLYPSDEGKSIIRIDGLIRNNANVKIGETIEVSKTKAVPAEEITVRPLESVPPIDPHYINDALESVAVVKGDNVMLPYFGGRLTFQVVEIKPEGPIIVTIKTIFHIEGQAQPQTDKKFARFGLRLACAQEILSDQTNSTNLVEIARRYQDMLDKL